MGYTVGLSFLTISFIYSIILNIVFFSKKHIKTKETKIFGIIVFLNLIGILLETACIFITNMMGVHSFLTIFVNKLFLLYLVSFLLVFSSYVIHLVEVAVDKENTKSAVKLIKKGLYGLTIITALGVCIFNTSLYCQDGATYSYGSSVNCVYFMASICTLGCIIYLLMNYRRINIRKNIPVIVFITGIGIMTIIQKKFPEITLATSVETIVIFLMYHTIENPDVQLINQLENANKKVQEASRAKTNFLSSMSHEIRTPLNAIVGFSECIEKAETLEEAKDNAKDIIDASNTLVEIVNSILDISKIEANKVNISCSNYKSIDTFEELAKWMIPKMKEKNLDFQYSISPDIPKVLYGDSFNIKKIITNLLSNAYKYTDKGFVKYEVSCTTSLDNVKLFITVEDSGRGIKSEDLDKIFDKFERVESNTTIEGTGLGLAIAKQLVELMGGEITVDSTYKKGSKFCVVLEQCLGEEINPLEKKDDITLNLENIKILLVDDNALNIKVAIKILEKYNANCITAVDSGFACLDKIKNNEKYDLILLDDMMPEMSGVETLQKLREIKDFNIPVIALTANAINGMKEKYIQKGFVDYLSKPIVKEELIRVLHNIIMDNSLEESSKKNSEIELLKLERTIPIPVVEEPPKIDKVKFLKNYDIDIEESLQLLGDMNMYDSTVSVYLKDVDERFQNIERYKLEKNMKDYQIEVHSLKSDAKYLGLTKLYEIAYSHELASRENNLEYVEEHFEELLQEYEKTLEILKKYQNIEN